MTARSATTDDEAALEQLEQRQARAWADGDGPAWAATFTDDTDFVDWMGGRLHGKPAIEESFQQGFDTFMAGTRMSPAAERIVRFVTPDVALVITSGNCVLRPGETRCRPEDLSVQTKVAVRRAGNWLFTSFHNSRMRRADPA
ncbi:uncharacterized protein (TIGR02246 family) [Saccharomonospora amisosensis]|uniref:Uncharacterized protein (TIGR02246 family) n=1 Tax=Saccharomonospora amisosensis TaxID=1128677 RepID=A0A7X5UPY6_9PSEU|nr:SgcJ/EcaC family oxidoreductase [Saccharomonospora amisosensis]NIJ11578.1 uncharacterized protein (TIGR02246 family) [Saccharomonospora amisosensis]